MSAELEKKCPECGGVIPEGSAHCPACMLGRAMGNEDSLGEFHDDTTSSVEAALITEGVGDSIGNYKLLEKIGEGGFGVVYMAKQEKPVRRQVVLKIIKLGMDTKQVVGRFEAERQALAMMEHPSIAKVLDAGSTEAGRPYFVMELVHGVPITEFCNENRLTTGERLKLFVKVCNAVQHAHQKGIIHRDLKPSNILVTMHDDEAVPKVIDFGIAKATQHDLTDKTLFTQFRHFLGTPAYMSPEQAQMSGLGVDTRSDIYSLGVLLYELLTGCTPLDLKPAMASGYDEVRRTIREEEPMKPSAFVSQLSGPRQTTLMKQSRTSAGSLHSQLRGDLDWIVMRAIEKDRTRRYETANLFARDVDLFLRDEPVSAVAPSAWYLLSKVVRRHKPIFAGLALVLPLLVIATGVSVFLYLQALNSTRNLLVMKEHLQSEIDERVVLNRNLKATNKELQKTIQRERLARYASDIAVAHNHISRAEYSLADRVLERHIPMDPSAADVREFSWYYLKDKASGLQHGRLVEPGKRLSMGGFSPDGKWLLTLTTLGEGIVWDVILRKKVKHFKLADVGRALSGGFSPDGRYLMIRDRSVRTDPGYELNVHLWRVEGNLFERLPSTQYRAWPIWSSYNRANISSAVVFIPGSSLLAMMGDKGNGNHAENDIILYDLDRAEVVKTIPNAGTILDISPDGTTLITQRWQQNPPETVFWDTRSGEELRRQSDLTDRFLSYLGSNQVLIRRDSGAMELRDALTLQRVKFPFSIDFLVDDVHPFGNGRFFKLMSYSGPSCRIWDFKTGEMIEYWNKSVHLSPDGKLLASVTPSGSVSLVTLGAVNLQRSIDRLTSVPSVLEKNQIIVDDGESGKSLAYELPRLDSVEIVSNDPVVGGEESGIYWTRVGAASQGENDRLVPIGREAGEAEVEVLSGQEVDVHLLGSDRLLFRYRRPDRLEVRDRKTLAVNCSRDFPRSTFGGPVGLLLPDEDLYFPIPASAAMVAGKPPAVSLETLQPATGFEGFTLYRYATFVASEQRLLVVTLEGRVLEYQMPERRLVDDSYLLGAPVIQAALSPDGKTWAVKRSNGGTSALELLSRGAKQPLFYVDIPQGARLRWPMFSKNGDALMYFTSNYANDEEALHWLPAPRAE